MEDWVWLLRGREILEKFWDLSNKIGALSHFLDFNYFIGGRHNRLFPFLPISLRPISPIWKCLDQGRLQERGCPGYSFAQLCSIHDSSVGNHRYLSLFFYLKYFDLMRCCYNFNASGLNLSEINLILNYWFRGRISYCVPAFLTNIRQGWPIYKLQL